MDSDGMTIEERVRRIEERLNAQGRELLGALDQAMTPVGSHLAELSSAMRAAVDGVSARVAAVEERQETQGNELAALLDAGTEVEGRVTALEAK